MKRYEPRLGDLFFETSYDGGKLLLLRMIIAIKGNSIETFDTFSGDLAVYNPPEHDFVNVHRLEAWLRDGALTISRLE